MKYIEIYRKGLETLKKNKVENAEFDNRIIFQNRFGMDRAKLAVNSESQADIVEEKLFFEDVCLRVSGEPLQYIVGEWEFLGLDFEVGRGVLIPREETEILPTLAMETLKKENKSKVVFDLCSGSGCVGISVAKNCKNAQVYLIEKSKDALRYLRKNVEKYNLKNVKIIEGDITLGFQNFKLPTPDIILSNPPYIKSDDVNALQKEVQKEPRMALDGGNDGLYFYKILDEKWIPYLSDNGYIAVEIGDNQDKEVKNIFAKKLSKIEAVPDFNNIVRVIIGKK